MNILVTSIVDLERVPFNRIHVFLKHLAQNHQVTALCLNAWWLEDSGPGNKLQDPYFQQVFDRVQISHLAASKVPPALQETLSVNKLRSLLKNGTDFDLHINYASLVAGLFVTRTLNTRGIPTVLDIPDDLPAAFMVSARIPDPLRWLAGTVSKILLKVNVGLAEKVTFISKTLQLKYALPNTKSTFLPNGVDTELFKEHSTEEARKHLGINPNAFVLGFVGTLGEEWVDFTPVYTSLKELLHNIPELKLLIVGSGVGLNHNKNLAEQYGVADTVIFTGYVPHDQVPRYITCMDVCIIPFTNLALPDNASPIKLFEYMACKRPVISTLSTGVIESVGEHVLYAADKEAWGEQIIKLYQDPALRTRIGAEGRAFVTENYSWSKICQGFETVLSETM